MTEVRFYHLQRMPLERALPTMLERTLARGQRAVVIAGSEERVEALAAQLWTWRPDSFLPHGTARDGNAARQPIWLTAADENPNGAEVLFLTDGAGTARLASFQLCADLFDGNDAAAVAAARRRWAACKAAGHSLTYWQQDEAGRWRSESRDSATGGQGPET